MILRNLINTSQNVIQKYPLSFQDIENALFFNKNPEFTTYPFSYKALKRTSITFEASFLNKQRTDLKFVFSIIKKINNKEILEEDKNNISLTLTPFIITQFLEILKIWQNYVLENIEEFCTTEISIINWKTLQSCGITSIFNTDLTFFQKLWISINVQKDRDFWLKTATDIREGLLPWMNYDLWSSIEKNKVNRRENIAYDEQKKAMVESGTENLDKISQNTDKKEYEEADLDIIT